MIVFLLLVVVMVLVGLWVEVVMVSISGLWLVVVCVEMIFVIMKYMLVLDVVVLVSLIGYDVEGV